MMDSYWRRALRVGLISVPYFAGLMLLVGVPAFALGGTLALKIVIALALPVLAIYVIRRHGRQNGKILG